MANEAILMEIQGEVAKIGDRSSKTGNSSNPFRVITGIETSSPMETLDRSLREIFQGTTGSPRAKSTEDTIGIETDMSPIRPGTEESLDVQFNNRINDELVREIEQLREEVDKWQTRTAEAYTERDILMSEILQLVRGNMGSKSTIMAGTSEPDDRTVRFQPTLPSQIKDGCASFEGDLRGPMLSPGCVPKANKQSNPGLTTGSGESGCSNRVEATGVNRFSELKTSVSPAILAMLPTFTANASDLFECERWLECFLDMAVRFSWDQGVMKYVMEQKLSPVARTAYFAGLGNMRNISIEERVEQFKILFSKMRGRQRGFTMLNQVRQLPGESIGACQQRLIAMADTIDIPLSKEALDGVLLNQFLIAIADPEFKRDVQRKRFIFFRDAVEYALDMERFYEDKPTMRSGIVQAVAQSESMEAVPSSGQSCCHPRLVQVYEVHSKKGHTNDGSLTECFSQESGTMNVPSRKFQPTQSGSQRGRPEMKRVPRAIRCNSCGRIGHLSKYCNKNNGNNGRENNVQPLKHQRLPPMNIRPGQKARSCFPDTVIKKIDKRNKLEYRSFWFPGTPGGKCRKGRTKALEQARVCKRETKDPTVSGRPRLRKHKGQVVLTKGVGIVTSSSDYDKEETKFVKDRHHKGRRRVNIRLISGYPGRPIIQVNVGRRRLMALVDSGAEVTVMSEGVIPQEQMRRLSGSTRLSSPVSSESMRGFSAMVEFTLGGVHTCHEVVIAPMRMREPVEMILGMDFFRRHQAKLDLQNHEVTFNIACGEQCGRAIPKEVNERGFNCYAIGNQEKIERQCLYPTSIKEVERKKGTKPDNSYYHANFGARRKHPTPTPIICEVCHYVGHIRKYCRKNIERNKAEINNYYDKIGIENPPATPSGMTQPKRKNNAKRDHHVSWQVLNHNALGYNTFVET